MKMSNTKKKLKKIFKWTAMLAASYFVLTTLYFGYHNVDEKKGVDIFYWSGFNALWNDNKDFGVKQNVGYVTKFDGEDGPYIIGNKLYRIDRDNNFIQTYHNSDQTIRVTGGEKEEISFSVKLKKRHIREPATYPMPDRLIAISDIEGNFNALYSFLLNNRVIDQNLNWAFGTGHVVFNGDFVDRGNNVTQVLWLIYKLEEQAEEAGGKVHFVLGNHEIMNMYGDVSYADTKYMEAAKRISGEAHWDKAMRYLYSNKAEFGKWLRTKNVVEKIGPYIFVHAGIKTEIIREGLDLAEINQIAARNYGVYPEKDKYNETEKLVLGSYHSPYWDRSYSINLLYRVVYFVHDPFGAVYHKTSQAELNEVLKYYNANAMVIGHSVVNDITSDYEGKVIKIDIKHGREKNSGLTKGLLIENGQKYNVNDLAEKVKL